MSTDITVRRRADDEIRLRDERFQALIAATGQIVWTNSADGRMLGAQSGWGGFTGQSQAEYEEFGWVNAVHPDDQAPTVSAWNAAVASRGMFVFEHRVRGADGAYSKFAIRAIPLLEDNGEIREWVGSHMSIRTSAYPPRCTHRTGNPLAEAGVSPAVALKLSEHTFRVRRRL